MNCPHYKTEMTEIRCSECGVLICKSCLGASNYEATERPGLPTSAVLCLDCYDRLDRGESPEDE